MNVTTDQPTPSDETAPEEAETTDATDASKNRSFSDATIADALRKVHGRVHHASILCGCVPSTIHRRLQQSPELRQICQDARGRLLDQAEMELEKAIYEGQAWAVKHVLESSMARERGYGKHVAQEHSGHVDHQHTFDPEAMTRLRQELVGRPDILEQHRQAMLDRAAAGELPEMPAKDEQQGNSRGGHDETSPENE